MSSIGTAYVNVKGDYSSISSSLGSFFTGGKFGKFGKIAGAGFVAGFAAAGVGKALFDLGEDFDKAYDKIRIGTGATGRALDRLKSDFRDVAGNTPADMNAVSTTIADLNTRLGLTDQPLRTLSMQMLDLSRITKTEVGENIESTTRLFGDWSVATKDQSKTLDGLFRVSQATGIGVSDLSRLMVQFGSPLRNLGIDFDFAASMFARFEKDGVNIQTMMPGLRMALKNFAKEGEDPAKALAEAFEGIKDGTVDMTEAFKIFGARAAPDMFAAVREGRFDVDDLMKTFHNGEDTISGVARETESLGEKWQRLKNNLKVKLEPIASGVFDGASDALATLEAFDFDELVNDVRRSLGIGSESFREFGQSAQAVTREIGPILHGLAGIFSSVLLPAVRAVLPGIILTLKGFATQIRGIVKVISGILTLDFGKAWEGVKDIFAGQIKVVAGVLSSSTAILRAAAAAAARGIWSGIKSAVGGAVEAMKFLLGKVIDAHKAFLGASYKVGRAVIGKVRDGIASLWKAFWGLGGFLMNKLKDGLIAGVKGLAGIGSKIVGGIKKGIGKISIPFRLFGGRLPGGGLPVSQLGHDKGGFGKVGALAGRFGNVVTSGHRPGDPGWHGKNRARDYAGGNMLAFAKAVAARFGGGLLELIHTPLGFGIKNGRKVSNSFFGPAVMADHYDHVHVAMRRGGKAGPNSGGPSVVYGEGKKDEWWISQEGDRQKNINWATEALASLTGNRAAMFARGGKKARQKAARSVRIFNAKAARADALDAAYDDPRYTVNLQSRLAQIDKLLRNRYLSSSDRNALLNQRGQVAQDLRDNASAADPNQPLIDAMNAAAEAARQQAEATQRHAEALAANSEEQRKNREFAERVNAASSSVTETSLAAMLDKTLGGKLSQFMLTNSPRFAP